MLISNANTASTYEYKRHSRDSRAHMWYICSKYLYIIYLYNVYLQSTMYGQQYIQSRCVCHKYKYTIDKYKYTNKEIQIHKYSSTVWVRLAPHWGFREGSTVLTQAHEAFWKHTLVYIQFFNDDNNHKNYDENNDNEWIYGPTWFVNFFLSFQRSDTQWNFQSIYVVVAKKNYIYQISNEIALLLGQ